MEDKKHLQEMITSYAGWHFKQRYEGLDLWQTPTCWLACVPYLKIFKFAKDLKTAFEAAQEQLVRKLR